MISDARLIILGSGTSSGVPVIGCECAICTSSDSRDKRTRSSACLQFRDGLGQERVVLIDTSPDLREQALRHQLKRCDAIFFTHNHVDHVFGLDDVRRFNAMMRAPIPIYADAHTMESLFRVFKHIFDRDNNINDSFVATLLPHLLDVEKPVDLLGLRMTPLRLLHGRQPVLGFRMDAIDAEGKRIVFDDQAGPLPLAYCTDVSSIPPETWPQLRGLRTLVLDMLRYRHHPTHLTVDQAIAAAETIGARQTFFTHMTHDILHAELDPKLPATMHLGYDGLVIERPRDRELPD